MPRIKFSDVTPPERRSIRDIPIPNSGKRKVPIVIKPLSQMPPKDLVTDDNVDVTPSNEPIMNEPIAQPKQSAPIFNTVSDFRSKPPETPEVAPIKNNDPYEYYYPKTKKTSSGEKNVAPRKKGKAFVFGSIVVILILGFIVSMMTVFASATINITPKTQKISVDTKIVAVTDNSVPGAIKYEVTKLTQSKTASIPATGEEAVELKASGEIVVYNNFSPDPQRLITRTRFESPEGLIYRIADSIVVPGRTIKDGVETPGSIEATVFADEAGEKYNIKKTDFTIPGFKNDDVRFKNFYARSLTNMTGGFVGKQKTVLAADKQTALQSIESDLEASLKKDLGSKVPEGLVMLSGSIIYKWSELPQKEDGAGVALGKEVTAYAIMLNKKDLSDLIANKYVASSSDWENIKSTLKDFSPLQVLNLPDNLEAGGKIELQIKGNVDVLADIDTKLIGEKLAGAPKAAAGKLMDEFAGISSITASIRPVWKQSFPSDSSKIYVQPVGLK